MNKVKERLVLVAAYLSLFFSKIGSWFKRNAKYFWLFAKLSVWGIIPLVNTCLFADGKKPGLLILHAVALGFILGMAFVSAMNQYIADSYKPEGP